MKARKRRALALSIYVTNRGYAFSLFEGADRAVDWGTREHRGTDAQSRCLVTVTELLDHYQPDDLVLEEWRVRHCRRPDRIRALYRSFERLGKRRGQAVVCYTRQSVGAHFQELGARTKHERATEIAARVPALAFWAPPKRELWKSEHSRMAIFDAAALNIIHLQPRDGDGA